MSGQQWQPPPGNWGQQPAPAQQPAYPQQGAPPPQYQQPQQPTYPQAPAPQPPQGYPQQPAYPQAPPPPQTWGQQAPAAPQVYQQQPYGQQHAQPSSTLDDPFADMNSGEQIRSLPFLGSDGEDGPVIEGDYKLELRGAKYKNLRKGGKAIITEWNILESNQPQRPAGTAVSVFLMQGKDMSGINTTAWISSLHGVDPIKLPKNSTSAPWVDARAGRSLLWKEYAYEAVGDANPWAMRRIGASVVDIAKKNGDRYGRVDWQPYDSMVIPQRTFAPPPPAPIPYVPNGAPQPGAFAPPGQAPGQWGQPPAAAYPQTQGAPQAPQAPQQNWGPPPGAQAPQQPPQQPQAPLPQQWNAPPPQQPQQPVQQWGQQPNVPAPGTWGGPPRQG